MTITICIDRQVNWRPGKHVNRWSKLRSVRVWWLWFAVAWYRFDDYHLVTERHEWSDPDDVTAVQPWPREAG